MVPIPSRATLIGLAGLCLALGLGLGMLLLVFSILRSIQQADAPNLLEPAASFQGVLTWRDPRPFFRPLLAGAVIALTAFVSWRLRRRRGAVRFLPGILGALFILGMVLPLSPFAPHSSGEQAAGRSSALSGSFSPFAVALLFLGTLALLVLALLSDRHRWARYAYGMLAFAWLGMLVWQLGPNLIASAPQAEASELTQAARAGKAVAAANDFAAGRELESAGRAREAQTAFKRALEEGTISQLPQGQEAAAQGALALARSLQASGERREATAAYRDAVQTGMDSGTPAGLEAASKAALGLGRDLNASRRAHDATTSFQRSLEAGTASGTPDGKATAAEAALELGKNLRNAGLKDLAWTAFNRSLETGQASETPEGLAAAAGASLELGIDLDQSGRTQDANLALRQAMDLGLASESPTGREAAAEAALELGKNLDADGQEVEAEAVFRNAIDLGASSGTPEGRVAGARAALELGKNLEGAGRGEEALAAFETAESLGSGSGLPSGIETADEASLAIGLASSTTPSVRAALDSMKRPGGLRLENGASLATAVNSGVALSPGATTEQAGQPYRVPVLEVSGASRIRYLRTAVGEVYLSGTWQLLETVPVLYAPPASLPALVQSRLAPEIWERKGRFAFIPRDSRAPLARDGPKTVTIRPAAPFEAIAQGPLPTSRYVESVGTNGAFDPFSGTFSSMQSVAQYTYQTTTVTVPRDLLAAETAAPWNEYLQLPPDLPPRVKRFAIEITAEAATAHQKAAAIEEYLRSRYEYRFAGDDPSSTARPPGQDPVDWFLFDHPSGTCGNFSSAFVILARAAGLPARVVSGWAISPTSQKQVVFADQAHQWAEVAFNTVGWVEFEPTPGGPCVRCRASTESSGLGAPSLDDGGSRITPATPPPTASASSSRPASPSPVAAPSATPSRSSPPTPAPTPTPAPSRTLVPTPVASPTPVRTVSPTPVPSRVPARTPSSTPAPSPTPSGSPSSTPAVSPTPARTPPPSTPAASATPVKTASPTPPATASPVASPTAIPSATPAPAQEPPPTEMPSATPQPVPAPSPAETWTEITTLPPRLRAGETATVGGMVVTGSRSLVTGLPVDIYFNTEKATTGGLLVGSGFVQGGLFAISMLVPPDLPPRAYHVIAHTSGDSRYLESWSDPDVEVYSGTHLRFSGPTLTLIDTAASFTGKVTQENGVPVPLGPVEVNVEGQTYPLLTREDGTFGISHVFSQPGAYRVTARFVGSAFLLEKAGEISVQVLAPAHVTLQGPHQVAVGQAYEIHGRLADGDGDALPDLPIRISVIPDSDEITVRTDPEGGFQWSRAFDRVGLRLVQASFAGTDRFAPADGEASTVVMLPARLSIDAPLFALTGEEIEAIILLTDLSGAPLPARNVQVTFDDESLVAMTDSLGIVRMRRALVTPGKRVIFAMASPPELLSGAAAEREVVSRTAALLSVALDGNARAGAPVEVRATLQDSLGQPIESALLEILALGAEAATDESGIATLRFTVPRDARTTMLPVRIDFAGNETHAPASVATELPLSHGFPFWPLGGFVLAGIAGFGFGGGIVWTFQRRRAGTWPALAAVGKGPKRSTARRNLRHVSEAPRTADGDGSTPDVPEVAAPRATSLTMAFPQLTPSLPLVWGRGEPLAAVFDLRGEDGNGIPEARLRLGAVGPEHGWLTAGADGRCAVELVFEEPGTLTISCAFEGTAGLLPSHAVSQLRIVDYREEAVRLFNSYLAPFRTAGVLPKDATPREAEVVLVSRQLVGEVRALDTLITVFEEANYSLHPITRRQYERAFTAHTKLQRQEPPS